ncbi:MAG: acetyl-CoA carboxylase biotin carboxyl carrier protein [Cyanobacteria bacterium]|nr:acetyl-CoA carboxylase biotin carboxyl carrier protein [Cyanobacteriota bacterium]MDA0866812.1 acetyl-CoA carboxylase biotin carboxyl carrier protein [Cyanobacteriota bacterium]
MDLNVSELRELVAALNQTDISELILKSGDFELTLRKPGAMTVVAAPAPEVAVPVVAAPAPATTPAAPASAPVPPPTVDPNLVEITSPMVGTFYRSPAPDEAVFVEQGDRIKTGQTVCIIEAMKLMNELEAEISGEIVEILVENAQPVEFGQPLMRVRTS